MMRFFILILLLTPLSVLSLEQDKAPNPSDIDFLVNKLDYINSIVEQDYPGRKAIQLRLAHALFLASEQNFTKSHKENCSDCSQKANFFAKRSLKLYKQLEPVLKDRHTLLYTEALFKQAYLERSLGNSSRSLSFLKRVIQVKGVNPLWTTRAWYNIGEIEFELYNYKKALKAFDEVLKQSSWRFQSRYRKIWSLFNLSLYESAFQELISFLTSKDYSPADLSLDNKNLKQKLETEIEILYSYVEITKSRLIFLYDFLKQSVVKNTESEKLKRISRLAKRLKQLGRLEESNQAWKFYLSKTKSPSDQFIAYSSLFENSLALGAVGKLNEMGETALKLLALINQLGMENSSALKNIKLFFDQIQLKSLSEKQKLYLLSLYQEYNSLYPKDSDRLLKTGILSEELKNYEQAVASYQKSALLLVNPSSLKESLCFKQLEAAELSKKPALRLKAYSFYIENGSKDSLIFKSKYQMAYIYYTEKNFKKAHLLFNSLAFYDSKKEDSYTKDLKLKSAHLSLSSLKEIGDQEESLITQAGQFMKNFPQDKKEFTKIYNLAILNQVKKLLLGKDFSHRPVQASTDQKVKRAWSVLTKFSVKEAGDAELLSYYMNYMLLAKELLKLQDMDYSIKNLLSQPKLTAKDQKLVLTWKLWLEELRLNFKEVLKTVQLLYPEDQSEEHFLRLARLSELAGEDPVPYYKMLIKKYPQSPLIPTLVVSILEQSDKKTQRKYLLEYASFFSKKPDELIALIFKIDQGDRNFDFMKAFLKLDFMKNSSLAYFLDTIEKRNSFVQLLEKIQRFSSNKKIKYISLRKYTQAVSDFIKNTENLLKTQDWISRLFMASSLRQELAVFYNHVMNLPLPKGLTESEQLEYKTLLNDQMKTYKAQIQTLDQELTQLKSDNYLKDYKQNFQKSLVFQPYMKWELEQLFEVIEDEGFKDRVKQSVLTSVSFIEKPMPKIKISQSLYQHLKNNPFDLSALKQLLKIEKAKKNSALAFYLDQRIKEIESRKGIL